MKITLTREETAEQIRQYVEKNTGLGVESVAANNNSFDVIIGNSRKSSNSSSSSSIPSRKFDANSESNSSKDSTTVVIKLFSPELVSLSKEDEGTTLKYPIL